MCVVQFLFPLFFLFSVVLVGYSVCDVYWMYVRFLPTIDFFLNFGSVMVLLSSLESFSVDSVVTAGGDCMK